MALSEYAWKFGINEDEIWRDENLLKSGLTPLSATLGLDAETILRKKKRMEDQREALCGFSTQDLIEVGSITKAAPFRALPNNLQNPIHPMYQRERWKTADEALAIRDLEITRIPLGGGRPGSWEMSNPLIQEVCEPALRCASMMLTHTACTPWWHALTMDNWQPVPDNPEVQLKGFSKIYRPSPSKMRATKQKFDTGMVNYARHIRFAIGVDTNSWTGLTIPAEQTAADVDIDGDHEVTSDFDIEDADPIGPTVLISKGLVEPLLRTDLTVEERILTNLELIDIIVHETAHAIGELISENGREPCFEQEIYEELGHSCINAILGAQFMKLPVGTPNDTPVLALLQSKWPDPYREGQFPSLIPGWGHDSNKIAYYAVPVEWAERIQRSEYWEHFISEFGASGVKVFSTSNLMTTKDESQHIGYHAYNYDPPIRVCGASTLKRKRSSNDPSKTGNSQENNNDDDPLQGILPDLKEEEESDAGEHTYSNETLLEIVRRARYLKSVEEYKKVSGTEQRIRSELTTLNKTLKENFEIKEAKAIAEIQAETEQLRSYTELDCFPGKDFWKIPGSFEALILSWIQRSEQRNELLLAGVLWDQEVYAVSTTWLAKQLKQLESRGDLRRVLPLDQLDHFFGLLHCIKRICDVRKHLEDQANKVSEDITKMLYQTSNCAEKLEELQVDIGLVKKSISKRYAMMKNAQRHARHELQWLFSHLWLPKLTDKQQLHYRSQRGDVEKERSEI